MQIEPSLTLNESRHFSLTLRDVTAVLFRQKRILLISFVIIVLLVVLSGALTRSYMAEMKILVRRERVDPVVTSQPNAPPQVVQEEITESELNSEVELLNSQDLLRKVVIANSLQSKQTSWGSWFAESSEEVGIARAVRQLARTLKAEPLRKSNIISVSFESSDPDLAAHVLNSLAGLYLEKHLQVHRPTGEFTFFDRETEQLRRGLDRAENRLTDFTRQQGVVSAQLERDLTLQRLANWRPL